MLLRNLYSIAEDKVINIHLAEEKIQAVTSVENIFANEDKENCLSFENALVFPGLINSHDHLDFNLFPRLGNKIYNNYVEWGDDIHKQNKETINAVLKVPKSLRVQWGIYKNLLNGVTTVVNHGPKHKVENEWINVCRNSYTIHSVVLEKYWRIKLNLPFIKKQAFAIHIGEGTDNTTRSEIDKLIKWNLFNRDLIGIHAVAMKEKQASKFKALVWCPDSNYFLLGRTAGIDKLKLQTKILFGTDSTVSAEWNLWNHLRLARNEKVVSDTELYNMLTSIPAEVWPIPFCGKIASNYQAEIVIARKKTNLKTFDAFFNLNPEDVLLVMHKGKIMLFDAELLDQIPNVGISLFDFSKIHINGQGKYVRGNLPGLMKEIWDYYPEASFPVSV